MRVKVREYRVFVTVPLSVQERASVVSVLEGEGWKVVEVHEAKETLLYECTRLGFEVDIDENTHPIEVA